MPNERDTQEVLENDAPNRPRISVVLLVGLPASGKSSLARKLKKRFNEDDGTSNHLSTAERAEGNEADCRLIHIEYDDLEDSLLALSNLQDARNGNESNVGGRRRDAWNQARQQAIDLLEKKIRKIFAKSNSQTDLLPNVPASPAISNDTVFLMDDNFHLRGMRKQIHRLLLGYKPIQFGVLYLETPLEVCLERNRNRVGRRQIPSDVITKMNRSLEPPRAGWEPTKTIVRYDSRTDGSMMQSEFEEIVDFIKGCPSIIDLDSDNNVEIDAEQQAADRIKTSESQMHNLDKVLRSYVGRVAKFDKKFAKDANLARKKVMEEFKAGRISFACVGDSYVNFLINDAQLRLKLRKVLDLS